MTDQSHELLSLVGGIVAAYVSNNVVQLSDLSGLIKNVHAALSGLDNAPTNALSDQKPAVPVKKSITAEYIVCLEDGKHLKMLKRYLRSNYNMTPEEYRTKWGLPHDYPMVAPAYAKTRSDFAKKIGLGTHGKKAKAKRR